MNLWQMMLMNEGLLPTLLRSAEGEGGAGGGGDVGAPPADGGAEVTPPNDGASTTTETSTETSEGTSALSAAGEEGGDTAAPEGEVAAFDVGALTLPEGMEMPEELGGEFAAILNNPELAPQERGQQLMDLYAKGVGEAAEAAKGASLEAWQTMNNEWREAVKTLPEFSKGVDAEMGAVKQALITLGAGKDFFAAMDLTGAGNNPHVMQMLHRLTQPFREGSGVGGGANPTRTRSSADVMYPSMKPQG